MASYPLPEVRRKWSKGELSSEQLLGHLLQHLLDLSQRLNEVEKPGAHRAQQLEQARPEGSRPEARKPQS